MYVEIPRGGPAGSAGSMQRSAPTDLKQRAEAAWPDILSDLGCLGQAWVETESRALTVAHRTDLAGLRVRSGIGHVQGSDFALRLMLERCNALWPGLSPCGADRRPPETVVLEDAQRRRVLTLRFALENDPSGFLLRTLLRTHGRVPGECIRPAPLRPARPGLLQRLDADVIAALERRCIGLDDDIGLTDHAELAGLLPPRSRRPHDPSGAVAVDPQLVPCVMEAAADHIVLLRIVAGSDGCVLRVDSRPSAARRGHGSLYMRGDAMTLRLDTTALDSAQVCVRGQDPAAARELRLYGVDGRAIAVLASAPTASGGEHQVWSMLMNALVQ